MLSMMLCGQQYVAPAPSGDVKYWLRGLGGFTDESAYNVTTSITPTGYVNCRAYAGVINGARCIEFFVPYVGFNVALSALPYTRTSANEPFTYEIWVYYTGALTYRWLRFGNCSSISNTAGSFRAQIVPAASSMNNVLDFFDDSGNAIGSMALPKLTIDTVNFLRFSYDGTTMHVYHNGVLYNTGTVPITKLDMFVIISAQIGSGTNQYVYVDDIRVISGVALGAGYP